MSDRLNFIRPNLTWYSESWRSTRDALVEAEIVVRAGNDGDNYRGWEELHFAWYNLRTEGKPGFTPRLLAFEDQWRSFLDPPIQGLFATLGDLAESRIQPDDFAQLLLDQGFEDATEYKQGPSPFAFARRVNIYGQEVA